MTVAFSVTLVFALFCANDIPTVPRTIAIVSINFFMTNLLLDVMILEILSLEPFGSEFLVCSIEFICFMATHIVINPRAATNTCILH